MIDEAAIARVEKRFLSKRVYIFRGYYEGHWGYIARAESETSFTVRGGTLGNMEPIIDREDFRLMRDSDAEKYTN
jgi:hypothetical protein